MREEIYLKWSIHQIVNWEQTKPIKDVVHIHGTNDLVFPSIYIKKAIFISKATHAMILTHSKWFNNNLPRLIVEV